MINTYKILSLLLDYPTEKTQAILPSVMPILEKEELLNRASLRNMLFFLESIEEKSLFDWQQFYNKEKEGSLSFYLFDHLYSDIKKKEIAIRNLKQLFAVTYADLNLPERPDYLPIFLDYIAVTQTTLQGSVFLSGLIEVIKKIEIHLNKLDSPYRYLLSIILFLASNGTLKSLSVEEKLELIRMHACEAFLFSKKEDLEEF